MRMRPQCGAGMLVTFMRDGAAEAEYFRSGTGLQSLPPYSIVRTAGVQNIAIVGFVALQLPNDEEIELKHCKVTTDLTRILNIVALAGKESEGCGPPKEHTLRLSATNDLPI